MKILFLSAVAASVGGLMPANGSVITLGSSEARSCYLAADAGLATPQSLIECDRALLVEPLTDHDKMATHVNRGILHMIRNEAARAKADFETAIAIDASHPEPYLNLGILQYNKGDSRSALASFGKAIELGTRNAPLAYYARGLANEDAGNVKAAYSDFNRAASLRPEWKAPTRELARYSVRR